MNTRLRPVLAALAASLLTGAAHADITVGVSLPLTGPASGLGIPTRNGINLWPETIGGEKLRLVVLDDASDTTQSARNGRRLITEDKVDVIVGSTATPASVALADIAAEGQTVQISTSPVELPEGKGGWTFRVAQSTPLMAGAVVDHMKKQGVKTYAYLGYSDAYGETWLKAFTDLAGKAGLKPVATERFARADTSVTAQALKIVSARPDAILIGASGSGSAMPHKALVERGYKGKIYQTHGAASRDLIRIGGKDVEGAFVVAGLAVMPEALPENHPSKKVATDFVQRYEKQFGAGTRNQFAAHGYDAHLLLQAAVPEALKKGKPGTPEFRAALKEALEAGKPITITQGVVRYSPKDHFGLEENARVMLSVDKGDWKLAEDK
ncbi:ABC transporter substrate-binding protein [Noviherbaspirillum aridicola]|uniref:Branched-chain amino acid ABC transporter substrate-binding protein n=1 Tax=Noviherbaspirillum aridicola TaxID=2849687 RepID=A0ABQ4PZ74_9BURK|nr:ABC transporter substrate-binding protein [Noviherbaspirillum aridicola]GIZ50198.1 branched-chain amino acid ABC transporter substrate-binding protein [Noviherbaspirillum aridicola]